MSLARKHRPRRKSRADGQGSAPPQPPVASPTTEPGVPLVDSLVPPEMTVHEVIERLNTNRTQICLVVDEQRRLIGTVTDGDVRRGILRAIPMDAPVSAIMFKKPHMFRFGHDRGKALSHLQRNKLQHLPVVDFADRVVDLITLSTLTRPQSRRNWVVVMAGGRGTRMRPLTDSIPKPMLDVGGRPLLETTIRNCAAGGFSTFFIAVNYQADVIRNHFGNGAKLDVDIRYIEEAQPLGTAGPLGLLPGGAEDPVLVLNGDVLTKVDPTQLIAFHEEHEAMATMAVREHVMQVPYGVVDVDNLRIEAIREKPTGRYFINAGIYVLSPEVLRGVAAGTACDMPDLFDRLRHAGERTLAYPIREYWIDIGQIDDYQRANAEFLNTFLGATSG